MCMCSIWVRQFFTLKKAEGWLFIVFISDVSENHIALNKGGLKRGTLSNKRYTLMFHGADTVFGDIRQITESNIG